MSELLASPELLLLAVLLLIASALVVMSWGKHLPRQGDWLVGIGLLALVVAGGLGWGELADRAFVPETWLRGWIWPRGESGAITVGVLRDGLGLTWSIVAAVVAAAALIGAGRPARAERPGRFYAATGLSAAGVAVAWYAATPWLAMMGTAVVFFGGFLALGGRWDLSREAVIATRFGWERSWGLVLSLIGLFVLAGDRPALTLLPLTQAMDPASSWSAGSLTLSLGAGLLFFGAFAQLQPFPLLGWVMSESETYAPSRVLSAQVFPAWAVLAILVRLEPRLRDAGVFPDLGWCGLASAFLAALAGLLSPRWRTGLAAWVSAGFSLSVAVLAFAGGLPAFCLALGLGLGACALAAFASALEEGGTASNTAHKKALWAKTGCVVAAAAGTGCAGFVSAGGALRALTQVWNEPALVGTVGAVFFVTVFLGWKVAWQASAVKNNTQASWGVILMPYVLIVAALGALWAGTLTGGAIPGGPDRLFGSVESLLFGAGAERWGDEAVAQNACLLYWGLLALAVGAATWTGLRQPELWSRVSRSFPRFAAFVVSGYGVDGGMRGLRTAATWAGRLGERAIDPRWDPAGLPGRSVLTGARKVAAADLWFSKGLGAWVRGIAEVPSRALQLVQNGDVQWYLFFAVGAGIAILYYAAQKG